MEHQRLTGWCSAKVSGIYSLGTLANHSYTYRLSKNIPTEVTNFLKHMKNRTGATFIAFAAYTNADGKQTYARFSNISFTYTIQISWFRRYETEGLNFFASKKGYRMGPNNIIDLWKEYTIGKIVSNICCHTNHIIQFRGNRRGGQLGNTGGRSGPVPPIAG